MTGLLHDPAFLVTALGAVILVGLSKGGFGGAMGVVGVPLMALAIPPVQAAAILLPILILMDVAALWAWRHEKRDMRTYIIMLPGAIAGIALGWLTAAVVTENMVKLVVGLVAFGFALRWVWQKLAKSERAAAHRPVAGALWGVLSGFTSFVAHAGGPPYQVYTLPLRQDPKLYTATSVVFFFVMNVTKLIPYFALGELDRRNLVVAAALMPVAFVSTVAGAAVVKRMKPDIFYPIIYGLLFLLSLKLIYDGLSAL